MDDLSKEPMGGSTGEPVGELMGEPAGEPAEQASVFSELRCMVINIIGAEAAEFVDISEQSAFVTDLEMDSIQIMQLAEQVNELYGRQVDFLNLLSDKSLSELLELTVGDIVRFIETSI
jgi:acyl carrier protein